MDKLKEQQYYEDKVKPILENLIFQLVCEQPENVVEYMIDWLKKTGGYEDMNNLTFFNSG
jgi:hypothetical protein